MTEDHVIELSRLNESPILEFKREWYWNDQTSPEEMGVKWGEFLKDIIALHNAYVNQTGVKRYLIIGIDEADKTFFDINTSQIKQFNNFNNFKKELLQKTEKLLSMNTLEFNIEEKIIDGKRIVIFEISPPRYLLMLKNQLTTKTRTFDDGIVLIRKGQSNDEVRSANHEEVTAMLEELETYRKNRNELEIIESQVVKKDRSIGKTIELFISKNSNYTLEPESIIIKKDWEFNILFEHYQLSDILGKKTKFIYIQESASQAATHRYLREQKIITNDNISDIIILTERPEDVNAEKRKENLKNTFKIDNIWFVDDFGYEHLYKNCFEQYEKFNLPIYIESLIDSKENTKLSAHTTIANWYITKGQPLFIVKGHGGIGKTTLAKQFLDNVYLENPSSGILFIDSNHIINELSKISESTGKINDIFDFYLAQYGYYESSQDKFTKELLKLSMDNGSLVIVLDGLDEVIARLGEKFKVNEFIDSIYDSNSTLLERSKILITCREHFWDSAVTESKIIPEITLKPFNKDLAKSFFTQAFGDSTAKLSKAMEISEKIAIQPQEDEVTDDIYIPYVLDLIKYLVEQDSDVSLKGTLDSAILNLEFQDDFIVGSVCNREIKKLETLDIDAQLKFLIFIAIAPESSISIYKINDVLKSQGINPTDIIIDKIKGHPLLTLSGYNKLIFRYDFFNTYFKSLYLSLFLKKRKIEEFDENTKDLISSYVRYNNGFTKNIVERTIIDDEARFFIMDCLSAIDDKNTVTGKSLSSSLFMIPLTYLATSSIHQSNLETRTQLLCDFFEVSSEIVDLNIINLFGDEKIKPTFDFRKRTLRNCFFDNYEYFWDCNIDDKTRFYGSEFNNLIPRDNIRPNFFKDTFSNDCNVSGIKKILDSRNEHIQEKTESIKDDIVNFFKIFHERGNFYPKRQQQVKSKIYASKLIPTLLKHKVIENYTDKEKTTFVQYRVCEKYRPILNYLEQGGNSLLIDSVVELFIKK